MGDDDIDLDLLIKVTAPGRDYTDPVFNEEYMAIEELLMEFFENDHMKVGSWMMTPNPLVGGIRPLDMMFLRPGKMLSIVKRALNENKR